MKSQDVKRVSTEPNILLQAKKRRMFATWRDQERTQALLPVHQVEGWDRGILLVPELFTIDSGFPLPSEDNPMQWRVDPRIRRNWENTVEDRFERKRDLREKIKDIISNIEEKNLPDLRDALIVTTQSQTSSQELITTRTERGRKWVSARFFINTATSGCKRTTRISQAIETLQRLIERVTSRGSFDLEAAAGSKTLHEFRDEFFEERWTWLQSYTTWKAAMAVYLYPENIATPTLRDQAQTTPLFDTLVKDLAGNRRLTPNAACRTARRYSQYYRDVGSLTVEATCGVVVSRRQGTDCEERPRIDEELLFMFARGRVSESDTGTNVYWSMYHPIHDKKEREQSFWDRIPNTKTVTEIIGADRYRNHIYLFIKQVDEGEERLAYTRFNLSSWVWESPEELKRPQKVWTIRGGILEFTKVSADNPFEVVLVHGTDQNTPPELVIKEDLSTALVDLPESKKPTREGRYETAYWAQISEEGTDWEDADFNRVIKASYLPTNQKPLYPFMLRGTFQLLTAFKSSDKIALFTRKNGYEVGMGGTGPTHTNAIVVDFMTGESLVPATFPELGQDIGTGVFIGAFHWPSSNRLHCFWSEDGTTVEQQVIEVSKYRVDKLTPGKFKFDMSGTPPASVLKHLATHSGLGTRVAFQLNDDPQTGARQAYVGEISELDPFNYRLDKLKVVNRITPQIRTKWITNPSKEAALDPYHIPNRIPSSLKQRRRELTKTVLQDNATNTATNRTYIKESYYFVPMLIALRLHQSGEYQAALNWFRTIYDYTLPDTDDTRKIYSGLGIRVQTEFGNDRIVPERDTTWLQDPLNIHYLAENRPNTYTRFTQLSIVRCLLDYADTEFARDTAESVPRARQLYTDAVELLEAYELRQSENACDTLTTRLETIISQLIENQEDNVSDVSANWKPLAEKLVADVEQIRQYGRRQTVIAEIEDVLTSNDPPAPDEIPERLDSAISVAASAVQDAERNVFATVLEQQSGTMPKPYAAMLSDDITAQQANVVSIAAGQYQTDVFKLSGSYSWIISNFGTQSSPISLSFAFCVPKNPIIAALRVRAQNNLRKIDNCMNIAGMRRQLDPYAAPTDVASSLPQLSGGRLSLPGMTVQPTQYRYRTLLQRAREHVNTAQQIESSFLSMLQQRDAEDYTLLKARQDIELSRSEVKVQKLRVRSAEDEVTLAGLQRDRSQRQVDMYQEWIDAGLNQHEHIMIASYIAGGVAKSIAAQFSAAASIAQMAANAATGPTPVHIGAATAFTTVAAVATGFNAAATTIGIAADTAAQVASIHATQERRLQQWTGEKTLAEQDVGIGNQQVRIAERRQEITEGEQEIAEMRQGHAEDTVEFLNEKFTNRQLYDWMSNVLEEVYQYFLQQATATAKLAENQLAFERQQPPGSFIQADYWEIPAEGQRSTEEESQSRLGLTGSARLRKDLEQLDQYAFETDQRKQQLSKTISLAEQFPMEFQRFRETGEMTFETPMEMFDQKFPGNYLRLIKRVRTSVIALIPPREGISATLTNSGISRVVTGGDIFQTTTIRRSPESVQYTSPQEATGSFELEPQTDSGMLTPFEGNGVQTRWQFRMPKGSNPIDYNSIVDINITMEYTALHSEEYRQQILSELRNETTTDRVFRLFQDFDEVKYDLKNPDLTADPMAVSFEIAPEDFQPNLSDPRVKEVLLYFAGAEAGLANEAQIQLHFQGNETAEVMMQSSPDDGIVSTRRKQWEMSMSGIAPFGKWTLRLPNTPQVREQFTEDKIDDVIFVITCEGETDYS